MPVYLAHGFRWPRDGFTGIRVHVIVHNLEDVAVEYIQNEESADALRVSLRELFPKQMGYLEEAQTGRTLHFLEQYNPDDEISDAAVSQPYAFVADRVMTIAAGPNHTAVGSFNSRPTSSISHMTTTEAAPDPLLSATGAAVSSSATLPHDATALCLNIDEAMSAGPSGPPQAWEAFAEIRDKLAEGEKIGWWVVYNGDPDRAADPDSQDEDEDFEDDRVAGEVDAIGSHINRSPDDDDGARTPTQADPYITGLLGQPTLSLLPEGLKPLVPENLDYNHDLDSSEQIGTAIPHPPPSDSGRSSTRSDDKSSRSKGGRSFVNPLSLRRKPSKPNLQPQREDIPEPPKLKENSSSSSSSSKKEGFRQKFFGRGGDKK